MRDSTRGSEQRPSSNQIHLQFWFVVFGLIMGAIFPFFASIFVQFKSGMLVWFVVSCLAAGAIVGLINYRLVNNVLMRRLTAISTVVRAIGDGDFSQRCDIQAQGVIAEIVSGINDTSARLSKVVGHIAATARNLAEGSERLVTIIGTANTDVRDQQSETKYLVGAMDGLVTSIQQVALSAAQAAEAAHQANDDTAAGQQVISTTIQSINQLAGEVERTGQVIKQLESDSEKIGGVLDVIRGITEQTNLLALNAAIEAARAGEHGRGFSVVADEVRTLAQRTQESTLEIRHMIEQLQSATKNAVTVMEGGRTQAHASVQHAAKADESLCAIASAVKTITDKNSQIAGAAETQNSTAGAVSRKTETILASTEKAARHAQEATATVTQIKQLAVELQSALARLKSV